MRPGSGHCLSGKLSSFYLFMLYPYAIIVPFIIVHYDKPSFNVVMLGIIHTCTALRYKLAFKAMR